MQGLSIKNFKSYSKCSIAGFHPNINVIIGGNGQGKSNIFKAISFVLSDRLQINRTQFNNCMHRGIDVSSDTDIEVEVMIKEKEGSEDLVKMSKVWKSDLNETCYVNSKFTNKKQYENFVQSMRLSYTNPYNIVQQGKINQITLMDEFQLYRLLEEVTGAKKFNKRKQEALAILKKIQIQKQQTKMALQELDEKLKSLQGKKQEFQFFAIEEKTKKYRTKKHLDQLLEGTRHNLQKIKNQYTQATEALTKLLIKKKGIQQELEQGNIFIRTAKEKVAFIQRTTATIVDPQTQALETQDFKDFQKRQKQLHKDLKQYAREIKEKDKKILEFKNQFVEIEEKYENMKINKEFQKNESKDKVVSAFEAEIKSEEQRLKQIQQQKNRVFKKIQQIQKHLKSKKILQSEQEFDNLQKQLSNLREDIQLNKKQYNQMMIFRGVTSVQCDSLKEMLNQHQTKMKRFMPYLDFTLLDTLRESRVPGVYGYFIEFVKIDEDVSFAYEMAGMTKLCSLLVEDQQACTNVIEINKKIKGRQVNIIQLDYTRNKPIDTQSIPKNSNIHKLVNNKWIKPDAKLLQDYPDKLVQDVQKLIKNTFGKYALVKDYQTGLKASKEYHLNCITNDREVVYSEGYHCKLGQESAHHQSNIQMFYKFQEKRIVYHKKLTEKRQTQAKLLNCQHDEIELFNKHQRLEIQLNKLTNFANQMKTQRKMLQIYNKNIDQFKKSEKDYEISISRKKQTIKNVTSKNGTKNKQSIKLSKAQCDKIQQEYHKKRRQLNKMMTEAFQIEQIMQKLRLQKEQIDNKILITKNNIAAGIIQPKAIGREIQKQLVQKSQMLAKLEDELHRLNKSEKQIEADKDVLQIKLITYRAQEQDLESKLEDIGEIEQNIQQLQELSNSMSVSNLHGRKRGHHFSAKDRLLFNKFGNILESFATHKKTFTDLQDAEEKIKSTIERYEKDSEEYMSQMAQKFEKQFIDIFTYIANQGNVEVRFKKITEKIKQVIRYKNCLMIRVSFSSSAEAMKKWTDFSGGEKTVIAISMILALQRCQPAPFYILDQIDSALDSIFVQKIAEILVRQSQRNRCQYFISSFKQDMMAFPEQICHFYMVENENRVSTVGKVSRRKAADTLKSLVMRQ